MKVHFFAIPAAESEPATSELNALLASSRVRDLERHFVSDGPQSYWAICITTVEGDGPLPKARAAGRIDYQKVLSVEDFGVYAKLRALRKELAERESLPAYQVLNNAQLAQLVTERVETEDAFAAVPGIGKDRTQRYADSFLAILRSEVPQLSKPQEGER